MIYLAGERDWLEFSPDGLRAARAFPAVREASFVICDPPRSVTGVASLEGDSRHAAVLIERRLRHEGSIEGECKVFVHHVERIGQGYQALYTAWPLDEWQRLLAWSLAQRQHALLLSAPALLWACRRPGQFLVFHNESRLTLLGQLDRQLLHFNTIAFTEDTIRYVVHPTLTVPPVKLFKADPLGLTGGLVPERTQANGLDLCLQLLTLEQSRLGVPAGGNPLALALQAPASGLDAANHTRVWLDAAAAPAQLVLTTRAQGYLEALDRLGCMPALARVADGVKSTAALRDLTRVARLNLRLAQLDQKQAREDLINIFWRIGNRVALATQAGFNIAYTYTQMETSWVAIASGAFQIASMSAALAGSVIVIEIAARSIGAALEHSSAAAASVTTAGQLVNELQAGAQASADRTNVLQNAGLLP